MADPSAVERFLASETDDEPMTHVRRKRIVLPRERAPTPLVKNIDYDHYERHRALKNPTTRYECLWLYLLLEPWNPEGVLPMVPDDMAAIVGHYMGLGKRREGAIRSKLQAREAILNANGYTSWIHHEIRYAGWSPVNGRDIPEARLLTYPKWRKKNTEYRCACKRLFEQRSFNRHVKWCIAKQLEKHVPFAHFCAKARRRVDI